jgi:hypothetical protein
LARLLQPRAERDAEVDTVEQQPQENPLRADRYRDAEAELGGADDVEKTTYVVGQGTDPNARKGSRAAAAGVGRGAPTMVLIVVLVLAVLVALAYMIGLMH